MDLARQIKIPFHLLFPKIHILAIGPDGPLEELKELWNRSVSEPYFESKELLRRNIFFHPLAEEPLCVVATRKEQLLGFAVGIKQPPDEEGFKYGSLEAIAVDLDFRRRGLASMLLQSLKKKFLKEGIQRMSAFSNELFFPGLDPEMHEGVLKFLLSQGSWKTGYVEEMMLGPQDLRIPTDLRETEMKCQKLRIRFRLLEPGDHAPLLDFVKKECPEFHPRYQRRLGDLVSIPYDQEGIVIAQQDGKIIGCCSYTATNKKSSAACHFREQHWKDLFSSHQKSLYTMDDLFLAPPHRGKRIGAKLFHSFLELVVAHLQGTAVWNASSSLTKFYTQFGAKPIGRFIYLL